MSVESEGKICRYCGAEIGTPGETCPNCGVPHPDTAETRKPAISAILSALVPGLGQIYNGETAKGLLFLLAAVILFLSIGYLVGIVLYPVFWVYAVYDAYHCAKKINSGGLLPG